MTLPTITVWSDYVCPWCYVGLAEVERLRPRYDFTIDWRPFLLRPETPDEGLPLPDRVKAFIANPDNPLSARARALGITLVLDRPIVPSTRRAHQAAEWARTQGRFDALHHALLKRYWTHGENLHEWSTLRAAAADAGLDGGALQQAVESKAFVAPMQAALDAASELGVHAVPTFIVGGKFAIQGAQDVSVFARAFEQLGATPKSMSSNP